MRIRIFSFLLIVFFAIQVSAQSKDDVYQYINTYKSYAIAEMQRTGIPASIILAQGIHETEAGTSELVKKSNNHFGIKCKDTWTGKVVYHDDDERGECFRSYDSPFDSYKDHSDFLKNSPRYQFLFKIDPTDYQGWAYGLKKAGYATNIRYSQILIKLIEDFNLQQYSLIALGKIKPDEEIIAGSNFRSVPPPATDTKPDSATLVASYPVGEFVINNTRVIFAKAGSSLLAISEQYGIALSKIVEFNELSNSDVLNRDQLLFLQRKRKTGASAFHMVLSGETCYYISQAEGLRLESLLEYNHLSVGQEPAPGEKLWLQSMAPARPILLGQTALIKQKPDLKPGKMQWSDSGIFLDNLVKDSVFFAISNKYAAETEQIQQGNKLNSGNLAVGKQIIIYKN